MSILHVVPGTSDVSNGMVVVARLIAKEQRDALVFDLNKGLKAVARSGAEEVWVHGMWLPKEWAVCRNVLKSGKRLVRMTHGSLSPIYLKHQSPLKKWLVGPIERHFLRKADRVVATCEAETDWIRSYLGRRCPPIEVTDIKRFFNLNANQSHIHLPPSLNILYLGRRHQLKGINFLVEALAQLHGAVSYKFQAVSNTFGKEKDEVWNWCDVLILPTLSENFGLVIAEALERGKRVITTDGAPAWGDGNTYGGRLIYLKGYRSGSATDRVRLLKKAITDLAKERQ